MRFVFICLLFCCVNYLYAQEVESAERFSVIQKNIVFTRYSFFDGKFYLSFYENGVEVIQIAHTKDLDINNIRFTDGYLIIPAKNNCQNDNDVVVCLRKIKKRHANLYMPNFFELKLKANAENITSIINELKMIIETHAERDK